MKQNTIFRTFFMSGIFCLFVSSSMATNIRGRIFRHVNNQDIPAANVRVDLVIYNSNLRTWQTASSVVTGSDGFYFFLNFTPNQQFYISLNGRYYPAQNQPLVIQAINPGTPPYYQDMAPIQI